jgi:hypothetical protein
MKEPPPPQNGCLLHNVQYNLWTSGKHPVFHGPVSSHFLSISIAIPIIPTSGQSTSKKFQGLDNVGEQGHTSYLFFVYNCDGCRHQYLALMSLKTFDAGRPVALPSRTVLTRRCISFSLTSPSSKSEGESRLSIKSCARQARSLADNDNTSSRTFCNVVVN